MPGSHQHAETFYLEHLPASFMHLPAVCELVLLPPWSFTDRTCFIGRLRKEIEELKCLTRQTPTHTAAAAHAEPRPEAQSDREAQLTKPTTHVEVPVQEVQAMESPSAAAAPKADAPPEALEGSARAHAAAESRQAHIENSSIGSQQVERPSTSAPESSALASQALINASALVQGEPSMGEQQDNASDSVHSRVCSATAGLDKGPDQTLCTGAPTVIMEQSAFGLANLGPQGSGDASTFVADCGRDTDAAAEVAQDLAQEMDVEASGKRDPVVTAHMQADCHECDLSGGADSCGQGFAGVPEADDASKQKGPGSQPFQAAEDSPAQAAAAPVHGAGGDPGQAAAEMQDKLGSVVELVSAVCGSFSPHDAAGALLHNLQVLFLYLSRMKLH